MRVATDSTRAESPSLSTNQALSRGSTLGEGPSSNTEAYDLPTIVCEELAMLEKGPEYLGELEEDLSVGGVAAPSSTTYLSKEVFEQLAMLKEDRNVSEGTASLSTHSGSTVPYGARAATVAPSEADGGSTATVAPSEVDNGSAPTVLLSDADKALHEIFISTAFAAPVDKYPAGRGAVKKRAFHPEESMLNLSL